MIKRWLVLAAVLLAGCGSSPQLGTENYRLVESLRTAISSRRADWLDDNAKKITARHDAGQLDDAQFAALQAIVDDARSGDWEAAEQAVLELVKAQRREGS